MTMLVGTMPTIDSGMMNPAKRFRRDGSMEADGISSDNSPESTNGHVILRRKYSGSVKSGKGYCDTKYQTFRCKVLIIMGY